MKTYLSYSILCAALLTASQQVGLRAQDTAANTNAPMGRMVAQLVTVTAQVEAINPATREVTLKGPSGDEVTFTAGPQVKRLDEVQVGDFIRADYYISIAAEVRKPTAAEKQHPLVILDAAGKAPADLPPAAGVVRKFKVVTTIEALDRRTETVTVKGPLGHYFTARVADPERLTKVHIGQTIVIVYTEAIAISLEKVNKPNMG